MSKNKNTGRKPQPADPTNTELNAYFASLAEVPLVPPDGVVAELREGGVELVAAAELNLAPRFTAAEALALADDVGRLDVPRYELNLLYVFGVAAAKMWGGRAAEVGPEVSKSEHFGRLLADPDPFSVVAAGRANDRLGILADQLPPEMSLAALTHPTSRKIVEDAAFLAYLAAFSPSEVVDVATSLVHLMAQVYAVAFTDGAVKTFTPPAVVRVGKSA